MPILRKSAVVALSSVILAGCADESQFAARGAARREIISEDLAQLDDAGQPILARPERLSVDRTGRFFIADKSDKDVKVYGNDGRRVATWGRAGRGPGEFAALLTAQAFGDSVVAYDFEGARLTVFSPAGRYARAVSLARLSFAPWFVRAVDDSLFLAGAAVPGSVGRPLLALLRPDGSPVSTFFNPAKVVGTNPAVIQQMFVVADAAHGVVFAALAGGDSLWVFDYRGRPLGSAPLDPVQPVPTSRSLIESNRGRLQRPDGSYVVDGQRMLFSVVALDSGTVALQISKRDALRGTDLLEGGTLIVAAVQPGSGPAMVARTELTGGLPGSDRSGAPLVLRYASADQDRYAITRLRLADLAPGASP
ncbi:MAG TPA: hypothetical protein VFS20_17030 [Longimicrobium sp.]|nr:hypothetical protein [Longimicrobium sp.]